MSDVFECLARLLGCAARGTEPECALSADFERLYTLANEQNVWTVIYPLIIRLASEGKISIPDEYKKELESEFFGQYMILNRRREFRKKLFARFNEEGLEFCLLKGDSVAQYYAEPLNRGSSDVDIKIAPEDVEKCCAILTELGYRISPLLPGHHHFECVHQLGGLLEVHVSFCMDITENICFKNNVEFSEPLRTDSIDSIGEVRLLGYTDGLIFLLMHFIKHFISSGAGIRQLLDIILYIENNIDNIDIATVYKITESWGYRSFLDVIFAIGRRYFMSNIKGAEVDDETLGLVMADMENGGVFGYVDENRIGFYHSYLKLRSDELGVRASQKQRPLLKRIFPPKAELAANYPYLESFGILYPVAAAAKICTGIRNKIIIRKKKNNADAAMVENRLRMLEKAGLL